MPLLYILAIFVTISFQLNDAAVKIHCETNQMGRMGDDKYCMFCAEPRAADEDKHDCSKYYNLDNPKSRELVFHSEESGGCALRDPIGTVGVRIICQSDGNTYYYIIAHGVILGHYDPDNEIIPTKDKEWNFKSHLITFKCPGTRISTGEADNTIQLLETGKIEEALTRKSHEYKKGDKIHEYIFSDLAIMGGIYQLKTDDKGKVENIALLYEFNPIMQEKPVKLIDAAKILDEKPATIFWLACSSYMEKPSHLEFTPMTDLRPGPETTAAVKERRKTIFDRMLAQYRLCLDNFADQVSEMASELNTAIGDKIGNPKYPKANEKYQYIKTYVDSYKGGLDYYKSKKIDYYTLDEVYDDLSKLKFSFVVEYKTPIYQHIDELKSIKETVSAKQEYAASYYDYGGDIGYGIYDEYDSNDNGLSQYYQHILRKMKKQKKHHSHNHHDKYHSNH